MKHFDYTIKDASGIHARPAGQISKIAKEYADTVIIVEREGKTAKATQLMKLMGLGVKEGDVITVTVEGPSEVEASIALRNFFQNNL